MKQNQELANRLREVVLNGTWIANTNFKDQLKTVDWKEDITERKYTDVDTLAAAACAGGACEIDF